jgi:signal transduction histidine kinase
VAICGLHFTAMAAVSLDPSAMIPLPDALASPEWLAVAVTAVTLMIIVLSLAGSLMDQHLAERKASESTRLRRYVTELEATKRELEQTAAELTGALDQAAASSRAKSQFLATMSHELRTPLNAVLGFAELLKLQLYGPLGDPRYLGYAGDIHASGGHLLAVINDVLDFAKIDAGRLTLVEDEVDIPELLDSVLPMIRGAATEAGLTLSEEHEPELRLRGDRRRLKQILLNLLSNAVKFTPSGGRVKVTAERAGRDIAISVTDTGIGIDPADMPRALQAFGQIDNRLARAYEGTGLGLPLCMQLMELHGGTLTLDSAIGRGTEVTIRFPAERVITPLRVETVDPAFMPAQAEFRAAAGDD